MSKFLPSAPKHYLLTSSVDDEIPGLPTNADRGDVTNVLIRGRARAGINVAHGRFDAVDLVDAVMTFLDNSLQRFGVGDMFQ